MAELPPDVQRYELYPQWPHINYMKLKMLGDLGLLETTEVATVNELEAA